MSKRMLGIIAVGAAMTVGCFTEPVVKADDQVKAFTPAEATDPPKPEAEGPTGRPIETKATDTEEELTPPETNAPPPVVDDAPRPLIDPDRFYTIQVARVMVAPGDRPTNTEWDSSSPIAPELTKALDDLFQGPPQPAAMMLSKAASIVARAANAPDVVGRVSVVQSGFLRGSADLPKVPNTCIPSWGADRPEFHHLKIDDKLRLQVELFDSDVLADDRIGTVEVSLAALTRAARLDSVFMVPVYDQGDPNILYVGVNVLPE